MTAVTNFIFDVQAQSREESRDLWKLGEKSEKHFFTMVKHRGIVDFMYFVTQEDKSLHLGSHLKSQFRFILNLTFVLSDLKQFLLCLKYYFL